MKESLRAVCEDFVQARDTVKAALPMESGYLYPICANIFCARGVRPDVARLQAGKRLLKERTGVFSSFRGNLTAPVAAMLSLSSNPEARMDLSLGCYAVLKTEFSATEYLALAAFLVSEMGESLSVESAASRGRELYRRMKHLHPLITSSEDSVYAVLLSFSEKSDDVLLEDMETCYSLLRVRFSNANAVQAAAQVLCLGSGDPVEKTGRLIGLYDALREAGCRYGKTYELATLAALAILGEDTADLARDVADADAFLAGQKGYGLFGLDRKTRLMHAAMLTADDRTAELARTPAADAAEKTARGAARNAAITGTIALLAAQQAAMCAAMAGSAAAASSASH